jgi:hypothetical protein
MVRNAEVVENNEEGSKKVELIQDIYGYQVLRSASSFSVKYPTGTHGGYFTSLGGCFREIARATLTAKVSARQQQEKKNLDSLMGLIDSHSAMVERIAAKFKEIKVRDVLPKEE